MGLLRCGSLSPPARLIRRESPPAAQYQYAKMVELKRGKSNGSTLWVFHAWRSSSKSPDSASNWHIIQRAREWAMLHGICEVRIAIKCATRCIPDGIGSAQIGETAVSFWCSLINACSMRPIDFCQQAVSGFFHRGEAAIYLRIPH